MDISRTKHCHKQLGLTLIEVLIALAIVSIALTAVIKASSQNIRATNYLQDKTIATWVGQEVLSEIQVNLLAIPNGDQLKHKTSMLNKDWYVEASEEGTPNKRIKKIAVDVFPAKDEDTNASPMVTLTGYTYAKD